MYIALYFLIPFKVRVLEVSYFTTYLYASQLTSSFEGNQMGEI